MGIGNYKKENKPFVTGLVVILIIVIAFQQWIIADSDQLIVGAQEMSEIPGRYGDQASEEDLRDLNYPEYMIEIAVGEDYEGPAASFESPAGITMTERLNSIQKSYFDETDKLLVQYKELTSSGKDKFWDNIPQEDKAKMRQLLLNEMVEASDEQAEINVILDTKIEFVDEYGRKVTDSIRNLITIENAVFFYALDAWMMKGQILRGLKSMVPYFQFAKKADLAIKMSKVNKAMNAIADIERQMAASSNRKLWEKLLRTARNDLEVATLRADDAVKSIVIAKPAITTVTRRVGGKLIVETVETYYKGGKLLTKTSACQLSKAGKIIKTCKNPKVVAVVAIAALLGYQFFSEDDDISAPGYDSDIEFEPAR